MAKSKARKHKLHKLPQPQTEPPPPGAALPRYKKIVHRLLRGLEILGVVVGLFWGALWILPDLSIVPEQPLGNDAFLTPLLLQNSGHVPISNVSAYCIIEQATLANGAQLDRVAVFNYMHQIPLFRPKEISPIVCHSAFKQSLPVVSAAIRLVVSYKPWYYWKYRKLEFRFKTVHSADGSVIWERMADSDPN